MSTDSVLLEKSMEFAVRIVKLYQYLADEKKEFVMSKQLLRSGTSIGANVREGIYGQSRNDFTAKMSIALKEAVETEYWLDLLLRTGYLTEKQYGNIREDAGELARILTTTVRRMRKRT
jgi:four helix bundle protein